MTLGQRIQEERKRLGLSQESLGERLGVSRQAISKWEADGAVPEVDKLIALSRLFGVSLNELLQVDCPADTPEEEEQAAEEYTRRIRRRKVFKDVGHVLTGALVLAFAAALALLWGRVNTLEEQNADVKSSLSALRGQLSVLQLPQPAPAVTDDLFSARSCEVESLDLEAGTVTLRLSVTPKRYVEGMSAQFTVTGRDFINPVISDSITPSGQTFTAVLVCPLDDELTITAAIREEDATETRTLDTLYDLKKESGITLEVYWDKLNENMVDVGVTVGSRSAAKPAIVSLRAKKDGVILKEEKLVVSGEPWNEPDVVNADGTSISVVGPIIFYIHMENWPEGEIEAYLKDTDGREYVVPLKEN